MSHELLERLEASLVKVTSSNRNTQDCGPFRLMLSPVDDLIYLNYATPTGTGYQAGDVKATIEAFHAANRTPRLEFTRDLWPGLEALLEAEGFKLEAEQPTMVCTEAEFRPFNSESVQTKLLNVEDDLGELLSLANKAFGMDNLATPEQVEANRDQIRRGTLKCAGAYVDGIAAGCAFTQPCDGVCELAGVATAEAYRRRGVASTVSTHLMQDHFLTGDLIWLSAGDDTSKAVYERLGFRTVATHVNWVVGGV